jgi:hypothetical protein
MKSQTTLVTVKTHTPPAMLPVPPMPRPPAALERASAPSKAARLDPKAKPDDSAQFRADMLRRSQAPLTPAWGHGGLND